jgi:hypothetical protein
LNKTVTETNKPVDDVEDDESASAPGDDDSHGHEGEEAAEAIEGEEDDSAE